MLKAKDIKAKDRIRALRNISPNSIKAALNIKNSIKKVVLVEKRGIVRV